MKNLTVGQKIGGGFVLLILIAAVLGTVAAVTMRTVRTQASHMSTEFVPEARLGAALEEAVAHTQLATRSYGFTADAKYLKEIHHGIEEIEKHFAAARKLAETYPDLVKLRELLGRIQPALQTFKSAVNETEARNRTLVTSRETLDTAAATFLTNIDKIIQAQHQHLVGEVKESAPADKLLERRRKIALTNEIRGDGNAARIAVFKAQALRSPPVISEGLAVFEAMEARFKELRGLLKVPSDLEELDRAHQAALTYRTQMQQIQSGLTALEEVGRKRAEAGDTLLKLSAETAAAGMTRTIQAADEASAHLNRASWMVQTMLAVAVVVGIVVALIIIRSICRALRQTADSLGAGAEQIVAAAGQVSSSSQSLAEGASDQAASLEETSASIEEMTGMTRRNAESAEQAKAIAQAARTSADRSAASIGRLNTAMTELEGSSAEVAKIVKTIDEIAFQTNILALNAAVEAARAGEAGAGFAVVAEEVRSLAQRSAQAAKETAAKIENAQTKSEEGARISNEVTESLSGIIEQVRQLNGIVTEIAQASKEQSQGIDQVNQAVTRIDKITQSNAAGAEESASAAEELNAQAAELNQLVGNLLALVGGNRTGAPAARPRPAAAARGSSGLPVPPRPARKVQSDTALPGASVPVPTADAVELTFR
jgi:methyl-accepting chemotaxis protein